MNMLWIGAGAVGAAVLAFVFPACRDAAYRRRGLLPPSGQATMADVNRLVRTGHRLMAIRCYREIHHVGLAEARKAVDVLQETA